MSTRVLLVEPDFRLRERLCLGARTLGVVDRIGSFAEARPRLLSNQYDWLVTNIRLREHNGLHLMHIAVASALHTRVLVYGDVEDVSIGRDAQLAGAFYELREGVTGALSAYLKNAVPLHDRRNAARYDRRRDARGGRRCADFGIRLVRQPRIG